MPESSPINSTPLPSSLDTFIAIAVGNTRTRVGVLKGRECVKPRSLSSSEPDEVAMFVGALFDEFEFGAGEPVIFMSTVSASLGDAIEGAIREKFGWVIYRFGRDLEIPIKHTLTHAGEETVGQDRLLCAIGAYAIVKQACVVVDMGTAITADFVDGEGVFHGGAIMAGVSMMLEALHDGTTGLPTTKYRNPDPKSCAPAKDTPSAMILGVCAAVHGAIRYLAERYAQFYEGYPQIIATGGDMGVLEDDELIECFVPDLQLQGIRIACKRILQSDADDPSADGSADGE